MNVNDMRAGKFSRGRKVSDEDREIIRKKYGEGASISRLAKEYNLSWTGIKCIVDDAYYQRCKENNKEYCKSYKRENYNNNMQKHRDYKRQLHKEGKI